MNKGIVIGIIVIIVVIIGVASSLNLETYDDSSIDNIEENELIDDIEEIVIEPETTGRNLSVELSEEMELSSP